MDACNIRHVSANLWESAHLYGCLQHPPDGCMWAVEFWLIALCTRCSDFSGPRLKAARMVGECASPTWAGGGLVSSTCGLAPCGCPKLHPVHCTPAGSSKTLLQIQEEEAEHQARLAEQDAAAAAAAAASAAAAAPIPTGAGWAKGVAAGVVGMVARAKSLKQIQEEEMRQAAAAKAAAAAQQQQAAAAAARAGPTLGCVRLLGVTPAAWLREPVWSGCLHPVFCAMHCCCSALPRCTPTTMLLCPLWAAWQGGAHSSPHTAWTPACGVPLPGAPTGCPRLPISVGRAGFQADTSQNSCQSRRCWVACCRRWVACFPLCLSSCSISISSLQARYDNPKASSTQKLDSHGCCRRRDVIDRQLGAVAGPPAKTVWGVSAAAGRAPSLREVMHYEESAADLEGGASTGALGGPAAGSGGYWGEDYRMPIVLQLDVGMGLSCTGVWLQHWSLEEIRLRVAQPTCCSC
jgi:hypothetical protein